MLRICFIFLLIKFSTCDVPRPLLTLSTGTIRGTFQQSVNGTRYAAFEGIPYAKPPIGKYRFREPQPIKPWMGVWETNYLHTCLQYNHYIKPGLDRVVGNEDCLYLNVYTPQLNQAAMLDVIVYIHGGAFMFGAGFIYGPKIIMNRNVVYVNLNYRLGPLGFLSTGDNIVPGNMGMKDQVMALKWIKDNIQLFGGNPNSITLTGMSAGGASVHLHIMSPMSAGLFNKGFSLSGTALNPWVLTENSMCKAKKLGASMGCTMSNTKEMIDCLRNRPGRQIVQNVQQFFEFLYNPFSPFGIVVEPQSTLQPFLSEHPYRMLISGQVQKLPWITSVVQAEGLYPAAEFVSDPKYLDEISSRWQELAPFILDYNNTLDINNVNTHSEIAEKIKTQYLQEKPISRTTFNELVQMIGDRLFVSDSQNAAKLHASVSMAPVYYYYFTYRGAHSKSEKLAESLEDFGVSHGDDTVYVLSSDVDSRGTDNDIKISEILLDLWTSFAKTGVPTLQNNTWSTVSTTPEDPLKYLEIASPDNINERTSEDFGNAKFWLTLPFQENGHLVSKIKDEL